MCNHLTNFAILMDIIDDTAQFIQQMGIFDENIRLLISISISICIIFIIIALLTFKLFNGIFTKVRVQQNTQPLQIISSHSDNQNSQMMRQTRCSSSNRNFNDGERSNYSVARSLPKYQEYNAGIHESFSRYVSSDRDTS